MFVCIYIYIYEYIFFGFSWVERLAARIASRSVVTPRPSRGIVICHILQCCVAIMTTAERRRVSSIHVKYAVQTVSFRLWHDPIPGISNLDLYNVGTLFSSDLPLIYYSEFRKKCIGSISSHCDINDWMNYVKLYSDCLKKISATLQNCVYIVLKLQLLYVFISRREAVCMLDSDTISKPWVRCMLFEHRLKIKLAVSQRCHWDFCYCDWIHPLTYAHREWFAVFFFHKADFRSMFHGYFTITAWAIVW